MAKEGPEWRPTPSLILSFPFARCLCLGTAVSLWVSVSLLKFQSLHRCPWGCGQRAEQCQWGVVVRERPQGGGSCSATHPAYQTALGEGRGRRDSPALLPARLRPSLQRPRELEKAGDLEDPEKEGHMHRGDSERYRTERKEKQHRGRRDRDRDREGER